MQTGEPIAYFITWSVYGEHLRGDVRGWRRRRDGPQPPRPRLAAWRRERLKHPVLLLTPDQRSRVEQECRGHCRHRGWTLWAVNARSNHVHAVVTAADRSGGVVRDQLKANCTRGLRDGWAVFRDRPAWATGGDWKCVNTEDDLAARVAYVSEAQDAPRA